MLAAGSVMSLQLSAQSEATESAPEQPAQQQTEQAATAQTDSVRVTELQEIIVRGKRGWFENDKAVFVPTRQEKNISTTIESFLQNMSLPVLVYKENSIESRTGESISYYINGRPVSAVDVKTFWAKLAKRVEYYEHPLDPRYNGEPCVINFIMDEYEAGGITRGYASQNFPGGGFYTLSSKLEYKRMTFGLMLDGNVSRDHRGGSEGTEIYRDLFYDGVHYDQITREMDSHSWSRKNAVGATLSARYYTEKFQADHSVALSWNQNPGSGSRSTDLWSPNLFNSLSSETSSSGISVSP